MIIVFLILSLFAQLAANADRWQFGAIIKPNENIQITPVMDPSVKPIGLPAHTRILATEIALAVDPLVNNVTTFTAPISPKHSNDDMAGCLEIRFIKTITDVATVKAKLDKVKTGQIVLYTADDVSGLKEVYTNHKKEATIGFFAPSSKIPSELRDTLIKNGISFFENLVRPDGFKDDGITEDALYYGFKFVFSPFKNETSMPKSLEMRPPRKINLADLVVFNVTQKEVFKRCAGAKSPGDVRILTQKFGAQAPVFPQVKQAVLDPKTGKMGLCDHYGTHYDVPYHIDPFSYDTTRVPSTMDYPECVKVNVPVETLKNNTITLSDIEKFETAGIKKQIPNASIVLFDTGYGKKWESPEKYMVNFPGLSPEAAKWLVKERHVIAIGIDTLTLDEFSNARFNVFPTHSYLSGQGVITIVNIGRDLGSLPGYGARCVMSYLRFEKATAAQAAIFGLMDVPETSASKSSASTTVVIQ